MQKTLQNYLIFKGLYALFSLSLSIRKEQFVVYLNKVGESMYNELFEAIEKFDNIAIYRHKMPDCDALGSQNGLAELIRENYPNKEVKIYGQLTSNTLDKFPESNEEILEEIERSLVIVCDTANADRIDGEFWSFGKLSIKIDHHPVVENFCDINLVVETKPATCEMIFDIAADGCWKVGKLAADYLLTGLVTDTGRFRYRGVGVETFNAAVTALKSGVHLDDIYSGLYKRKLHEVKFSAWVSLNFKIDSGVGYIYVPKSVYEEFGIQDDAVKFAIGAMSGIDGINIWTLAYEKEDYVKVSIRSSSKVINHIAEKFAGGGHKLAAGAKATDESEFMDLVSKLVEVSSND